MGDKIRIIILTDYKHRNLQKVVGCFLYWRFDGNKSAGVMEVLWLFFCTFSLIVQL